MRAERFSRQDIPDKPGVYVFRSAAGEVIYVGKAKSLRRRLASYFQPSRRRTADAKLRSLINSIAQYEILTVQSESEALLLEERLIKQYGPRYNVELRDDKRFLLVKIDPSEQFPRLTLARLQKDDGSTYFGPFPRAGVLRQTLDFLNRHFGLRSCPTRDPTPGDHRHCLQHVVRKCCTPCLGDVSKDAYGERLAAAMRVLEGNTREILTRLDQRMRRLASQSKFEEAARVRDMIENLRALCDPRQRRFRRAVLQGEGGTAGREQVVDLQRALGLRPLPTHIECFDVSNIAGRLAVGSMVCFRNGKPSTRDYRRFRIRRVEGANDPAMMKELISRRYGRRVEGDAELPDLIVVDGGVAQLNAALEALAECGAPAVPVLGLAKKREEIYLPGRSAPIVLSRHRGGLRLLQALRDEAHRFALTYHRDLRRRRIADSVLVEVPGIGKTRCGQLLRTFGSVKRLAQSSAEEITAAVPGVGPKLAAQVLSYLRAHSSRA